MKQKLNGKTLVAMYAGVLLALLMAGISYADGVGHLVTMYSGLPNAQVLTQVAGPNRRIERILFDTAAGASLTVQVQLYDCSGTAYANSTTQIGQFTFVTDTARTGAATAGAQYTAPNSVNELNVVCLYGCYMGTVGLNPDTVTAMVIEGRPVPR